MGAIDKCRSLGAFLSLVAYAKNARKRDGRPLPANPS